MALQDDLDWLDDMIEMEETAEETAARLALEAGWDPGTAERMRAAREAICDGGEAASPDVGGLAGADAIDTLRPYGDPGVPPTVLTQLPSVQPNPNFMPAVETA